MITALAIALSTIGSVGLFLMFRREQVAHHETRKTLTESLGTLREERDAAILAVRWVPMVNAEFTALAKKGCNSCNSMGYVKGSQIATDQNGEQVRNDKGEPMVRAFTKVCTCVFKAMSNNAKYAAVADGIPVRLATKEEIAAALNTEKHDNVTPIGHAERSA